MTTMTVTTMKKMATISLMIAITDFKTLSQTSGILKNVITQSTATTAARADNRFEQKYMKF